MTDKTQLEAITDIIEYSPDTAKDQAQQILDLCQPKWIDMGSAPKDGTQVLLKLNKNQDISLSETWSGLQFVGKNNGNNMLWSFAAPVGVGGFPDEYFEGWMPLQSKGESE